MTACVYGVCDPQTGAILYIGQTTDLNRRIIEHERQYHGSNAFRSEPARALVAAGTPPVVRVLYRLPPNRLRGKGWDSWRYDQQHLNRAEALAMLTALRDGHPLHNSDREIRLARALIRRQFPEVLK